jgi:hypothetical protein
MDARRFIAGTVVGGIVLFFVGYLIFNMLLVGFYDANAGSATGVARAAPLMWSIALGCVAYAALICYALGGRAAGLGGGAKVGAIVGFLLWVTADFISYGTTNLSNLTLTMVDPLAAVVHAGIGGAVIGLVVAKMKPGT